MSESKIPGLIEDLRRQIAEAKADAELALKLAGQANNRSDVLGLMLAMRSDPDLAHYKCGERTIADSPRCLACFLDENTVMLAGGSK